MKKYWKSMFVTVLVIFTLGTFYVNASFATLKYPEFVIKHKTGDENEMKNVSLIGDLQDKETNIYTEITSDGTDYLVGFSYLDLVKGAEQTGLIKRLQKEYRNFMRGKGENENQFYEDENVLAYVNLKTDYGPSTYGEWLYSFDIDVLDKSMNKKMSFEVDVPDNKNINNVHIQHIQVRDGQIKIFAANQVAEETEQMNIYRDVLHEYSISIKKEELVQDYLLTSDDDYEDPNYSVSTNVLSHSGEIGKNDNVVYAVDVTQETFDNDGFNDYQIIDQQLIHYNLKTKEQEVIILPDEYDNVVPEFIKDENIYFSRETEGQLELILYNLKTKSVVGLQTFDLPILDIDSKLRYTFHGDKIYLTKQLKEDGADTVITIAQVDTGDILYEGSVEIVEKGNKKYIIEMNFMEVK